MYLRSYLPKSRLVGILRSRIQTTLLFFAAFLLFSAAKAEPSYPQRPITMIVPVAAGGPGDASARALVDRMAAELGRPLIIENVPGAGGTTGTARFARAAPDGYTVLLSQVGLTFAKHLYPNLPFDPERDFTAVGLVNESFSFLVGRASLPVSNFQGLVEWSKKSGQPLRFAHPGVGTSAHLHSVLLAAAAGLDATFVPYRGGGPALQDIIGGHADINVAGAAAVLPMIKDGTVKSFMVMSKHRDDSVPNIPSIAELGYPDLSVSFWHAMWVRKDTPEVIVNKLNAALNAALQHPDVKRAYAVQGLKAFPPEMMTTNASNEFVRSQEVFWAKILNESKIKIEP